MDETYLMLFNNECTSDTCNITDKIKDYCMQNDNLVTEDICHNLYTTNVYTYYGNNDLSKKLKEVCNEYPMHKRCSCANRQRTYNYDKNNLIAGYGLNCFFPECSKNNLNRDPTNKNSSLIPYDIYELDNSCPTNVCQVIIEDSELNLYSSDLAIANNCETKYNIPIDNNNKPINNNNNPINNDTKSEFPIWIIIVIFAFAILFLLIIFVVVINNRKRKQKRILKRMPTSMSTSV